MFDALTLACYIKEKYSKIYNTDISNIKLQKSLYFLFAYWGGFIRKSTLGSVEQNLSKLNEKLFNDRIEAWTYGPVVPDVYRQIDSYDTPENRNKAVRILSNKENDYVRNYIDSLLEDLFEVSDFKLVDMSHNDISWNRNYIINAVEHNTEIQHEMIITEYAARN